MWSRSQAALCGLQSPGHLERPAPKAAGHGMHEFSEKIRWVYMVEYHLIYIYDIYDVYIYIHIKQGIVLLLKLAVSCDSRAVFFFYAHWVGLHCWSWMIFHGKLLVITRWLWLTWFNQRENDGVHQSWSVHGYAYTMLCCIQLQLTLNFGHCRRHGGVRVTRHINGHFRILNWRYLPYI